MRYRRERRLGAALVLGAAGRPLTTEVSAVPMSHTGISAAKLPAIFICFPRLLLCLLLDSSATT
jgi:hypothetical protein